MLAELAALELRAGRVDEAQAHARKSLVIAERLHDRPGRVFGVGLLACVAAEREQFDRAGRLWGAIEDERAFAPLGGWQRHRNERHERIRERATPAFDAAVVAGRKLELVGAVALARPPTGDDRGDAARTRRGGVERRARYRRAV